ncbi:MAG: PHP domain-containing protein [Lachnospiraceae bacterium]|nr:PHP domain-containing protein [Lachnospiraceae bacterium]
METTIQKIDLHMHTTMSDGTDTPEEIIGKVRDAGIKIFSVTDHDAINGCTIIIGALRDGDPVFIPGAEFNSRDEGGRYHILGYGFDPEAPSINGIVEAAHELRMKKVHARLDFLRKELGFDLPEDEIAKLLELNNTGKPHIANLLVRYGYAENKEQGIEYIDRKHFKSEYLHPKDVITAIRDAGGIPVLAHPPYGSGNEIIVKEELSERVERLIGYGIEGLEGYYSGFTNVLRDEVLSLADRHDLLVTAGSDYHGSNKLVVLGDTGLDVEAPADGLCRFLSKIL